MKEIKAIIRPHRLQAVLVQRDPRRGHHPARGCIQRLNRFFSYRHTGERRGLHCSVLRPARTLHDNRQARRRAPQRRVLRTIDGHDHTTRSSGLSAGRRSHENKR